MVISQGKSSERDVRWQRRVALRYMNSRKLPCLKNTLLNLKVMSMSNEIMAELHKDFIYNLMVKGEREDMRAFDQCREITIETNVINKAEGSARVKIGETNPVVGVKIQPG